MAAGISHPKKKAAIDSPELKRAEKARYELERQYRALASASYEVAYRMSADWSTMQPLEGRQLVASSAAPLVDWAWLEQNIPLEEHPRIRQAISEAIASRSLFELEHRVRRPDGTIGWTLSRAVPILDEGGEVTAWFGAAGDITARKQAEEALKKGEEHLRHALEAASAGAWDWDIRSGKIVWSPENYRLFDIDPAQGPPSYADWVSRVHPEDRDRANEHARAVLEGHVAEFRSEFRVVSRQGAVRWVKGIGRVERDADGQPLRLSGLSLDITERKLAEQTLAERTEMLNAVLASTTDVIFVKDLDGRMVLANAAFAAATRSTPEQLVGKTDAEWFPPEVAAAVRQQDEAVIAGGSPIQFEETLPVAGEARVFDTLKAPLRDGSSRVVGILGIGRDITERRRADEALRASEVKYRALFESMDDGFAEIEVVMDADRKVTDWRFLNINQAFERLTGLKDAAGKLISELVPHLDPDWAEKNAHVVNTGEAVRYEMAATPLGRWFDVFLSRVGGAGSRRLAVVFNNITERKQRELDLAFLAEVSHELEELTNIADTMKALGAKIAGYFNASRFAFSEFNEAADGGECKYDWHEAGASSLVGRYRTADFFDDEFIRTLRAGEAFVLRDRDTDPRVKAEGLASLDIAAHVVIPLNRDGRLRCILCIYDHRVRVWQDPEVELMRELTARIWTRLERARAEEALRESDQHYRQLVHGMAGAAFTTDAQGIIVLYNAAAVELWGRTPEPGERWCGAFKLFARDGSPLPLDETPLATAFKEGRAVVRDEIVIERPDGTRRIVQASAIPLLDIGGQVMGGVNTLMDVTGHKQLESALSKVADELSDADRRKDEFLAMLAHELRNPLAPLRTGLEVLDASGSQDPDMVHVRTMMKRQMDQMVRLVDDLLDVSRVSRGKISLRKETVDLRSVIDQAIEAVRPSTQRAEQRLDITMPEQPIPMEVDPARMAQVISNLLGNASKFTERGGRISLEVLRIADSVVIHVRDNGIGLSPALVPRIFDLFVQADTSLGRTVSGLGIGLTLVKSLVRLHGGSVEASSNGLGQGSTFTVRLPASVPVLEPAVEEPTAPAGTVPTKRRILVVDDNHDAADSMASLLKMMGHEVYTAYDGEQGLAAAEDHRPHVLLLDIGLPRIDGYEAARRIRGQAWGKDIYLIAITGWGQEEDRCKAREAGFDEHLVKPVAISRIKEVLSAALEARHMAGLVPGD